MSKIIPCKSRQKVEVGVGGGGREAQNVCILNFQRQNTRYLAAEPGWKMCATRRVRNFARSFTTFDLKSVTFAPH